ncbi:MULTISPECIES: helix-turn-helix domain-containing protein [Catenuloplanes]|uniref:Transcriptional regulator with XRE-family HTH domain n=1 Tax=Catenuloplanes niger TaxID=587534 RepID=A0AAE3ZSH3_9ACTN|nr:helix-turn-helix transcriptional regulator [Catenuloplanes niger]MDR7324204.1 transcriptional regulator with XRE-family HTH domain [Catenuloplanes niger]
MDAEPGSTVPRRQLGRYLRRLREQAGVTVKAAAAELECSIQKLWRIEKGAVPVRGADVKVLCQRYGASEEMTQALVALAKETKAKGWWHSYGDVVPRWFEVYVGMEAAASRLRMYEPSLVPGLLQSRDYADAAIRADQPGMGDEERRRRVDLRRERQELLARSFPEPPALEAIVCETVLRRDPGPPGVMARQLAYLQKAGEQPHISIRVLPLAIGLHRASVAGAFTILEFPSEGNERREPPTVYSESLTGAIYLDKSQEIEAYEEVWVSLAASALSEGDSAAMITSLIRELNRSD